MNEKEIEFFLEESSLRLHVEHEQFFDWLRKVFFLAEELQKGYNRFYQELFYVRVYQFITEGKNYIGEILKVKTPKSIDYSKYNEIKLCIDKIESSLTDDELALLEYQRHCSCHMFQNHYELLLKNNGGINTKRKGRNIIELREKIREILSDHRDKSGFDKYFNDKLYPIVTSLYEKIKK